MKEQCCRAYANKLADKIVAVVDELSESEDSRTTKSRKRKTRTTTKTTTKTTSPRGGIRKQRRGCRHGRGRARSRRQLRGRAASRAFCNQAQAPPLATPPGRTSLGDDFDDLMHNELDMPAFVAMCKEYIPAETFADIGAIPKPRLGGRSLSPPSPCQVATHHRAQAPLGAGAACAPQPCFLKYIDFLFNDYTTTSNFCLLSTLAIVHIYGRHVDCPVASVHLSTSPASGSCADVAVYKIVLPGVVNGVSRSPSLPAFSMLMLASSYLSRVCPHRKRAVHALGRRLVVRVKLVARLRSSLAQGPNPWTHCV